MKKSLQANLKEFLLSWSINEPVDQFALQFDGSNDLMMTEKNYNEIKDGTMLRVVHSPSRRVADLCRDLLHTEARKESFEHLISLCKQPVYASEFCAQSGIKLLVELIGKF